MDDYEKMYKTLFNAMTTANHLLLRAALTIQTAQAACEDLYIEAGGEQYLQKCELVGDDLMT